MKRSKKFSEEETTEPKIGVAEITEALGASKVPIGQIQLSKVPPLDFAKVESEYGWWEAITGSDVRLLEAWLAHHGAVIVSTRTVEKFDAFFRAVASRRSIKMLDHEAGFVLRRVA